LAEGCRRAMGSQALEKCSNVHHGLLRRLRVVAVADDNSTTTLRQKPYQVRKFWRRYCLAISIFLEYISNTNMGRSSEIVCDPLSSLRRFSCTVLWPWAPAYCFG
jgi:hypothetical protein